MAARHGPTHSTCALNLMPLTCGHNARSWGYRILATCQMWKSKETLVVRRFLTRWLTDICGCSAVLLAVHLLRIITEPLQWLSDWKRPTERPSHTWLHAIEADLGPLNFSHATAWWKAITWDEWRHIVHTATLQWSTLWMKKKNKKTIHSVTVHKPLFWLPREKNSAGSLF